MGFSHWTKQMYYKAKKITMKNSLPPEPDPPNQEENAVIEPLAVSLLPQHEDRQQNRAWIKEKCQRVLICCLSFILLSVWTFASIIIAKKRPESPEGPAILLNLESAEGLSKLLILLALFAFNSILIRFITKNVNDTQYWRNIIAGLKILVQFILIGFGFHMSEGRQVGGAIFIEVILSWTQILTCACCLIVECWKKMQRKVPNPTTFQPCSTMKLCVGVIGVSVYTLICVFVCFCYLTTDPSDKKGRTEFSLIMLFVINLGASCATCLKACKVDTCCKFSVANATITLLSLLLMEYIRIFATGATAFLYLLYITLYSILSLFVWALYTVYKWFEERKTYTIAGVNDDTPPGTV